MSHASSLHFKMTVDFHHINAAAFTLFTWLHLIIKDSILCLTQFCDSSIKCTTADAKEANMHCFLFSTASLINNISVNYSILEINNKDMYIGIEFSVQHDRLK